MLSSLTVPAFTRQTLLAAAGRRPTPAEFSHAWQAAVARAEPLLEDLENAYEHALQKLTRAAAARFKRHAHPLANITASAEDMPQFLIPDQRLIYDDIIAMLVLRSATQPLRTKIADTILKDVGVELGLRFDLTNPLFGNALEQVGQKITQITETQRGEIMATLQKSYEAGDSIQHAAQALVEQGNILSVSRAQLIARTEFIGTVNGASLAAAQIGTAARWKQWLATEDERTRDDHAEADGQVVPINEPFEVGDEALMYPGDPSGSAEETINCRCLPSGQMVSGANVTAAMQRTFEGNLVKLVTATGREITATPKHPVLTERGWLCIDEIREGDNLVCATPFRDSSSAHPDIADRPARIEEVYGALLLSSGTQRVGSGNFHGEIAQGEIDVAIADNVLSMGWVPPISEVLRELGVALTHREMSMSSSHTTRLGILEPNQVRLTATARLDAVVGEDDGDGATGNAEIAANGQTRFAGSVASNDLVLQVGSATPPPGSRARGLALSDAALAQATIDGHRGDASLVGDLLEGHAAFVKLDPVVNRVLLPYHGHVYNLSTVDGVYFADTILTANCTLIYPPDGGGM